VAWLVILAAGLGTRFGGLKQLTPIGPNGEAIMDLLLARAGKEGYDRAVVVIRPDIRGVVNAHFGRYPPPIPVELAEQTEPIGTADAVLTAQRAVRGPFVVANADDLYPVEAFALLARHIRMTNEHAMVAFRAGRTMVDDQPERRARIDIGEDGRLNGVVETTLCPSEGFDTDSWISMNLWGFQPSVFDALARAVAARSSSEVYLPDVAGAMVAGGALVRVILCELPCVGITRADDVDAVRRTLQ
jgi:bifunctional N-acetylglucosamine-1-phosphate-uridyltransferase/glucosamine-1-phosphate-acetyltransferase GlmU-like protein